MQKRIQFSKDEGPILGPLASALQRYARELGVDLCADAEIETSRPNLPCLKILIDESGEHFWSCRKEELGRLITGFIAGWTRRGRM